MIPILDDTEKKEKEVFYDFAQVDYNKIYDEIIKLAPEQETFVNSVKKIIPPQKNEIQRLQIQALDGNKYARQQIIEKHLRQALKAALNYSKKYKQPISETISIAIEGLIEAVDNYKPDKNGAFASYASMWMMQVIHRNILAKRYFIHYPVHVLEFYIIFFEDWEDYFSLEEIESMNDNFIRRVAKFLDWSIDMAKHILLAFLPFENFDDVYDEKNDNFKTSNISEYNFVDFNNLCEKNIEEDVIYIFIKEHIQMVLNTLPKREQEVINMRFGLNDSKSMTLEEIAKIYNITRERVRQIEAKAMKRLKHPRRIHNFQNYIYN